MVTIRIGFRQFPRPNCHAVPAGPRQIRRCTVYKVNTHSRLPAGGRSSMTLASIPTPAVPAARDAIAALLAEARARTMLLVAPLSHDELTTQHDPLMSPIVWDLGHIASFEELWLT